ncbi:MAG: helix-turn-helix domain-containing protein [Pseudonocardiaceae bacterium]
MDQSTFGEELRRLREQRGLSLKKFAKLVHYDPGYLSKIENGHKPLTGALATACDAVLEADGLFAQLVNDHAERGRRCSERSAHTSPPYPSAAWDPDEVADQALRLTGYDLALSRREALVDGTATLTGVALLDPLQNWLFPFSSKSGRQLRGLSEDEVAAIETGVCHLRSWARQPGGGMARQTVLAQLKNLSDRLRSVRPGALRDRAFLAGAELSRLVASLAWDAGSHSEAQRYYVLAVQMAHVARDYGYAALALADLARQSLDLGRPQDALELIQLAQYGSRASGVARLPAFLLTREAWALAHLDRPGDFSRAAERAEALFAETCSANSPRWMVSFDEAELYGVLGGRYRDLASIERRHARSAELYIHRALSLRAVDRIRSRTFDLIGLARNYLIMGEPEQGCVVARQAIQINGEPLQGRPERKLHDFCRELAPYWDTVAGRDFSEYLRYLSN